MADSPIYCGFAGDSDTYGFGVRLGLYLQWTATFISTGWVLPSAAPIRTANTLFQLASVVGLFVFTFHKPEVHAVEPLIILLITFGAAWYLILVAPNIDGSINEALLRVLVYTVVVGYMTWYFWAGMDVLVPSPCGTYAFFFAPVDLFGWFRVLGKVLSVMACLVFFLVWVYHVPTLLWARYPVLNRIVYKRKRPPRVQKAGDPREFGEDEPIEGKTIVLPKMIILLFLTCITIIFLLLMVIGAELMIYWNHIEGVYAIDSSGQLVPAALGLALLCTTIWEFCRTDDKDRRYYAVHVLSGGISTE